ncbi:unnamed protein product [Porites evermanni]|uniref:Heparanase n=1 Tax=Porites evermanni TaxID=104178 RepID=A0ABN8MNA3_9CNID|nr:unnamed protein product [Porites evermanni]
MAQYGYLSTSLTQRGVVFLILVYVNLHALSEQDVVFGRENYVEQNVSINLEHSVFTVSEKFLSVAIDASMMRNHWPHINFTSEKFYTLARGLSPAFLRVGGTSADFLIYNDSSGYNKFKNVTNFTITHEDLDKIHLLSSKANWNVMFGLNVLLRQKDGSWNASNPKQIMQYVAESDYHFGWELGNEPDHFKTYFNKSVSTEELAEDFKTLRAILKSTPQFGNFLVGPDVTTVGNHSRAALFLESFVSKAKDVIDAVTWHQYYLDGRTCTMKDFYNPDVLDKLLYELEEANDILDKLDPGTPRWLGETSSAYGGGAPGLSDRYGAGFLWLDKLGLAARMRHEVVIRQTFAGGNYALLNNDLDPNPDYWLSLLYKRLVGVKVLEVNGGTEEKRTTRVYAHCASRKYPVGAVTLLVLNIHNLDPAGLKLTGSLQQKQVEEYLLTTENSDLTSKTVRLNGKLLKLVDDHTFPDLIPAIVPGDKPLILPPLTFGFYVIPGASAGGCR